MLVRVMGYRGLALGTALAAMFNAGALLWLLRGRLGGLDGRARRRRARQDPRRVDGDGRRRVRGSIAWLQPALPPGVELDTATCRRASRLAIAAGVVVLVGSARLLRIEEFDDARRRACCAGSARRMTRDRRRVRLHPTILLMASAHVMVDGYGNIYAPLLPLLIPRLGLVARRGRHADDAVPAGGVGRAGRLRTARGSLAAARCW